MSDLSREAHEIIEAAAGADEPTAADKRRVKAAVMAAIAAPTAAGAGTAHAAGHGATATAAAKSGILIKLIAGAALIGALAVGGYLIVGGGDDPVATTAPATAPQPTPDPEPAPVIEPELEAEPAPVIEPEPKAEPAPEPEAEPKPARRTRPRAERASLETLMAEKKLIDGARRALAAGEPDRALALLADHAEQFPRGQLAAERAGTRVLALCDAGRTDDARREATRFLRRHGRHPMAPRVRGSCGQ